MCVRSSSLWHLYCVKVSKASETDAVESKPADCSAVGVAVQEEDVNVKEANMKEAKIRSETGEGSRVSVRFL